MHPSIQKLAELATSFPIFDRLLRYKLSALDKPDVISHLRALRRAGQATVLAVDLASHEVIVGYMEPGSPAARALIDGKLVTVPR